MTPSPTCEDFFILAKGKRTPSSSTQPPQPPKQERNSRGVKSLLILDTPMANVIHVGTNEAVLATRKTILEKAGHNVVLARDLREVMAACEAGSFDVGIIGQALPAMEKLRVTDTLRKLCSGIRILEFHDAIKPDVETADANLRVADTTPATFLDTITELARVHRKKGKASE